ncbi:hypothetical protein CU098_002631, partial [Rhizopus stolonifer]
MSLFGASANQPNTAFGSTANTQSSAGTLFGANPNANNSAGTNMNSSAGTLFGTSSNNSSAGTLFGAAASNPSSGGFGGFGQKPANNTFGQTSSAPTIGFGQTAPAASSSFSFGTSQPATANNNTGGFGAPNTGFGANTGSIGFGSFNTGTNTTQAAKPAFGGFGTNNAQTGFGAQGQQHTGFGQQGQQQQGNVPSQDHVWRELALVSAKFDTTSPLCHFRHYFYNIVPRNEMHLYVRPPNQDEQLWNEAVRNNPDSESLVPVLAVGFDDILKRME